MASPPSEPPLTLGEMLDVRGAPGGLRGPGGATSRPRTFGGLLAAQAVVAAGRTVPASRAVHSLHVTFLRAGRSGTPIDWTAEVVRDSRSFSLRRVEARQDDQALLVGTASFHAGEEGFEHDPPRLDVPGPAELPADETWLEQAGPDVAAWAGSFLLWHPLDVRFVTQPPPLQAAGGTRGTTVQFWARARHPLPDDPLLRAAAMTYTSDLYLLSAALLAQGRVLDDHLAGTSLDHAMWFHRPVQVADEWLLFEIEGSWSGAGRALARGQVRDGAGRLVASLTQEGLLRRRTPAG